MERTAVHLWEVIVLNASVYVVPKSIGQTIEPDGSTGRPVRWAASSAAMRRLVMERSRGGTTTKPACRVTRTDTTLLSLACPVQAMAAPRVKTLNALRCHLALRDSWSHLASSGNMSRRLGRDSYWELILIDTLTGGHLYSIPPPMTGTKVGES